ncbi:aminoglycoside phosphotransferase family protein [Paenibacillus sp. BK720]|uniref:phosphotransferase family protein n=1 Tax=Paenibacillus sp. BK720 TaxID=2587092 RepID=UPI00142374D4|nr:aminoglycoside phosphotransferase family protein [Paenibacillus sp. BK720]NIK69456.1 aminoglycoside phosphotransferase (APT) family kinase protein [Paenibacillus sp. BK720]
MENANKYRLSDKEIGTIVREAFGVSFRSAGELTDGWANMAYSIVLEDGRRVVLKIAPSADKRVMRYEKNMMRTEVEAMRLAAATPGLPVPRVYAYDASCSIIGAEYFFMDFAKGTAMNKIRDSLSLDEREAIARELGGYNRSINAYKNSFFGSLQPEGRRKDNWAEVFEGMMEDVLADGKDASVELPVSYAEIEKEVLRYGELLVAVKEASLVHWDLWDGNVFVHGGKISGLIDFERAFWGDPLSEFYFGRFAQNTLGAFCEGYGINGLTESERRRRVLYDFYLDLIMVIECTYRNYESKDHIKWAYENFVEGYKHLQSL